MSEAKPAVVLSTERETFQRHARSVLLKMARKRPHSVIVVARVGDDISVDAAGMSRLEMMGALHAAMIDLWGE